MKALGVQRFGSKDELTELEVTHPTVNEDAVIVEQYATSVNPLDFKLREGKKPDLDFPVVLGSDISGIIVEKGENVTKFSIGDRVFGVTAQSPGSTYAAYVSVPQDQIFRSPVNAGFLEAAALPLAGVTALQNLQDRMQLTDVDRLLVIGGAGGVGLFAIQIAKHLGATVTAVGSSDSQQLMKDAGADEVIDYKQQPVHTLSKTFTAIFDCVGGSSQDELFPLLERDGCLLSIARDPSEQLARKHSVTAAFTAISPSQSLLSKLCALYESETLTVHISETFPFTERGVQDAHEKIEKGHTKGKLVMKIQEDEER